MLVMEFFISKRDPLSFEILTIFLHSGSQGDICLFCFNDILVGWWVDLVMITKVCFLWWLVKKLCLNPLQAVGQWRHLLVPQGHLQWMISWSGDDYQSVFPLLWSFGGNAGGGPPNFGLNQYTIFKAFNCVTQLSCGKLW